MAFGSGTRRGSSKHTLPLDQVKEKKIKNGHIEQINDEFNIDELKDKLKCAYLFAASRAILSGSSSSKPTLIYDSIIAKIVQATTTHQFFSFESLSNIVETCFIKSGMFQDFTLTLRAHFNAICEFTPDDEVKLIDRLVYWFDPLGTGSELVNESMIPIQIRQRLPTSVKDTLTYNKWLVPLALGNILFSDDDFVEMYKHLNN